MRLGLTLIAVAVLLSAMAATSMANKLVLEDGFEDSLPNLSTTALPGEIKNFAEPDLPFQYLELRGLLTRFYQIENRSPTSGTASVAADHFNNIVGYEIVGAPTGATARGTLAYFLDSNIDLSGYPMAEITMIFKEPPVGLTEVTGELTDMDFYSASTTLTPRSFDPIRFDGLISFSKFPDYTPSLTNGLIFSLELTSQSDSMAVLDSISVHLIPEPDAKMLFGIGGVILGLWRLVSRHPTRAAVGSRV